jgi:peptide/nickel transport system substrate-binding protein
MKRRSLRLLAASSVGLAILLATLPMETARRPRYGGRLRVEIGAVVSSLNPIEAVASFETGAAKGEIDSLIYDVLEPKTRFTVMGAFHVTAFEAGKRAVLAATEDYRLGRPFVDSIEIVMGRGARERLVDLELNKTDFAEIPAEDARRAGERGVRVSRSKPDELLALVFTSRHGAGGSAPNESGGDARVRQAIALSIDRGAIVNFILQKEGEAAGGLLPQWSSGTAFLFSTAADSAHAKELLAQIVPAPKIVLGYDFGDSLEQAVAERIAVNAREAGIQLTAQAIRPSAPAAVQSASASTQSRVAAPDQARLGASEVDARIVRLRMQSKLPGAALEKLMDTLGAMTKIDATALPDPASPEDIYNRERAIVNSYRVVPLVWLPRVYGLSARVRDWTPPGAGEFWPLADVWLDRPPDAVSEEGSK